MQLLKLLSGKFCFGLVVGSCVIICRAGFHLLSESVDSTVGSLQPGMQYFLHSLGVGSLAAQRMAFLNRFTVSFR